MRISYSVLAVAALLTPPSLAQTQTQTRDGEESHLLTIPLVQQRRQAGSGNNPPSLLRRRGKKQVMDLEADCPPRLALRIADFDAFERINYRISAKYSTSQPLKQARRSAPVAQGKRQLSLTRSSGGATGASTVAPAATTTVSAPATVAATNATIQLQDYIVSHEDLDYMGTVNIGTPPKPYTLILDTGSSDLWVQSTNCSNCSKSTERFDIAQSSSIESKNATFDILYGIGSTSGDLYEDVVTVAGKTVQNQTFAVADQMSQDWLQQPASGILGLGFETNAKSGAPPFFENLLSSGAVSKPIFSFSFGRANDNQQSQSSLTLGGTDPSKYTGNINYLPVADPRFYWQLDMTSVNAGTVQTNKNADGTPKGAIIDTGSSLIAGPKDDVAAFWAAVPNATYDSYGAYWTYPCAAQVKASISFKGIDTPFLINETDLNFGKVSAFSTRCVGAVIEGNTSGYWILGLAFIKNFYTVFDAGAYQIGFATPTY